MNNLVGREHDITRLAALIVEPGVHAVVGPVGVGKTALLAAVVAPFGERALRVDVRSFRNAGGVLAAIAEQLDIDHRFDRLSVENASRLVAERLGATNIDLLVVDHLDQDDADGFELLGMLARESPALAVLVASRRFPTSPIGQVTRLRPLDIVASSDSESHAGLLFRQAFLRAGGELDALRSAVSDVDRLVGSTGGLPLVIILAASRAAVSGLDALAREAELRPLGDSGNENDLVTAALRGSLGDLDGAALSLVETLGVFQSPVFASEIAAACGLHLADISPGLEQLALRSVVETSGDLIRMLAPIRRLALVSAAERGLTDSLTQRHAEWAVGIAQAGTSTTTDLLRLELDLMAATSESVRTGRLHDAVVLAACLDDALRSDLRHTRRVDLLEPVLAACRQGVESPDANQQLIDDTIEMLRLTALARSDALGSAAAEELLNLTPALVQRSARSAHHVARLESLRAALAFEFGDLVAARHATDASIEAARACGDDLARFKATKLLADIELESGNIDRAVRLADGVVRLAFKVPRWVRSYALATVGAAELERGAIAIALAAARSIARDAIEYGDTDLLVEADWLSAMADPGQGPAADIRLAGDRIGNSTIHIQADIAKVLRRLAVRDWEAAITLAADCELRASAMPMRSLALDAQLLVGEAALGMAEHSEAHRAFSHALVDAVNHDFRLRVADALDGLADVCAAAPARAGAGADLAAAAAVLRRRLGAIARPRPWRAGLDRSAHGPPSDWVDGTNLTPTAIQEILKVDPARPAAAVLVPDRLAVLSPAERVVAGLVAEGCTNRQIGERLFVSRRTVETHIAHAFQKLGLTSRTQLAVIVLGRD